MMSDNTEADWSFDCDRGKPWWFPFEICRLDGIRRHNFIDYVGLLGRPGATQWLGLLSRGVDYVEGDGNQR